jgi:hypothetical protein
MLSRLMLELESALDFIRQGLRTNRVPSIERAKLGEYDRITSSDLIAIAHGVWKEYDGGGCCAQLGKLLPMAEELAAHAETDAEEPGEEAAGWTKRRSRTRHCESSTRSTRRPRRRTRPRRRASSSACSDPGGVGGG